MNNSLTLRKERIVRTLVVIGMVAISVFIVLKIKNMLVAFVLAFAIYHILAPFVNAIERTGVPRSISVIFLYVSIGILAGFGTYLLLPGISNQLLSFKNELPKYIEGTAGILSKTDQTLNSIFGTIYSIDIGKTVETKLFSFSKQTISNLPQIFSSSLTVMILAPFFAFFILLDSQKTIKKLLAIVPNNLFELALNLQHQMNAQIGGFVQAKLLESGIIGVVVWIGLISIAFPYSLLLASFAAITNLIPYLGPVIGAVPALLIALVNEKTALELICLMGVYLLAQLIDNIFIIPLVVAKIVNLHPVTATIVIIIGAQLGGIVGMIISIPVASIIKMTLTTVFQHFVEFRV